MKFWMVAAVICFGEAGSIYLVINNRPALALTITVIICIVVLFGEKIWDYIIHKIIHIGGHF